MKHTIKVDNIDEAVNERSRCPNNSVIIAPRVGVTTAKAQRYRLPSSLVHTKEKGRWSPTAQNYNTNHHEENEEEELCVLNLNVSMALYRHDRHLGVISFFEQNSREDPYLLFFKLC
jgi:hypothetical protein